MNRSTPMFTAGCIVPLDLALTGEVYLKWSITIIEETSNEVTEQIHFTPLSVAQKQCAYKNHN